LGSLSARLPIQAAGSMAIARMAKAQTAVRQLSWLSR